MIHLINIKIYVFIFLFILLYKTQIFFNEHALLFESAENHMMLEISLAKSMICPQFCARLRVK